MDDSASDTVKDGTPIVNKQPSTEEAENLGWQGSLTPIADPVSNGNGSKQVSSTKEAQNKVMATEENVEYPTGIKLGLISLALCLSVFLMALVCTVHYLTVIDIDMHHRTTLLLRQQSPISRINFTRSLTSAGMAQHTCLQLPHSSSSSANSTPSSPSNTSTLRRSDYLRLAV